MTNAVAAVRPPLQSPPDRPQFSVARLALLALVLPIARPRHSVAAGLLPCAVLVATGLLYPDASPLVLVCPGVSAAVALGLQINIAREQPALALVWLANLAALAHWLCAWQREAVLHFPEAGSFHRMRAIPLRSLRRLPQYLPAFAIWLVGSAVLVAMVRLAVRDAVVLLSPDPFEPVDSGNATIRLAIMLTALPLAAWVFARLSPLPVLAAANGWRGAFTASVRLTHGSLGLKLVLAYVGLLLLAQLLAFGAESLAERIIGIGALIRLLQAFRLIVLAVGLVSQFWLASLAALVTSERTKPMVAIDPARFD